MNKCAACFSSGALFAALLMYLNPAMSRLMGRHLRKTRSAPDRGRGPVRTLHHTGKASLFDVDGNSATCDEAKYEIVELGTGKFRVDVDLGVFGSDLLLDSGSDSLGLIVESEIDMPIYQCGKLACCIPVRGKISVPFLSGGTLEVGDNPVHISQEITISH